MATLPRGRGLGWLLSGGFVFFLLATLGFAFTIFGQIAMLLALICLVGAVAAFAGSRGSPQPLEDAYERWRTNDTGE